MAASTLLQVCDGAFQTLQLPIGKQMRCALTPAAIGIAGSDPPGMLLILDS